MVVTFADEMQVALCTRTGEERIQAAKLPRFEKSGSTSRVWISVPIISMEAHDLSPKILPIDDVCMQKGQIFLCKVAAAHCL